MLELLGPAMSITTAALRSRPMSGYPFNIRQVWLVVVLAKPCFNSAIENLPAPLRL